MVVDDRHVTPTTAESFAWCGIQVECERKQDRAMGYGLSIHE